MSFVPNQTFVGLAVYDPCAGAVGSVSSDCSAFSMSPTTLNVVPDGQPVVVLLTATSGGPTLRDSDQVNLYNGNCGTPRILGNTGMNVEWIAVQNTSLPPQWTVYIEAGAVPGTPISPMQPVVLRNNNTGLMVAVSSSGQLILANVSKQATCSWSGATNAAYFIFTSASDAITQTWNLPVWVPSFFPYWWQSVDNWWPQWWSPSSPSCPPWVVGCHGYHPPPPPPPDVCSRPFPPPWCKSDNGLPGGDRDNHGCIPSAGYRWCQALGRCVQPWNEPCQLLQPGPATPHIDAKTIIGGDSKTWAPKTANIGGDPKTWAPKTANIGGTPATWGPPLAPPAGGATAAMAAMTRVGSPVSASAMVSGFGGVGKPSAAAHMFGKRL